MRSSRFSLIESNGTHSVGDWVRPGDFLVTVENGRLGRTQSLSGYCGENNLPSSAESWTLIILRFNPQPIHSTMPYLLGGLSRSNKLTKSSTRSIRNSSWRKGCFTNTRNNAVKRLQLDTGRWPNRSTSLPLTSELSSETNMCPFQYMSLNFEQIHNTRNHVYVDLPLPFNLFLTLDKM